MMGNRWTLEEEAILQQYYPCALPEEILRALPGRPWSAIKLKAHRMRLVRQQRGRKPKPAAERFWRFVEKTDSCWNWTGRRAGGGSQAAYGAFFKAGSQADGSQSQVYAHRWAWEHFKGEIPEGFQVNHHCDNSLCVNPDHLYLGTQDENMHDLQ